jgi:protein JSN1
VEPEASNEIVQALFNSPGDHVLTDVLGDQVNGVAVVHKVLTSAYLDPVDRPGFLEATKRVLIELKVIATQAYRRLIEEVGLPIPNFQPQYSTNIPQPVKQKSTGQSSGFGMSGLATGYGGPDPSLASMMAAIQMQVNNSNGQVLSPTSPQNGPPQLQINPNYGQGGNRLRSSAPSGAAFSPTSDPFNPFSLRSPEFGGGSLPASRNNTRRTTPSTSSPSPMTGLPFNTQSPSLAQAGTVLGMSPGQYGVPQNGLPPHLYNAYMYQVFSGQNPQNVGAGFHN